MLSAGLQGAILALCISFLVLLAFLRNWALALLAVLHVAMIIAVSIASMVWLGWRFGFIEAVCVTVVAGFSVDFTAHIGIAYAESAANDRLTRTRDAIRQLGISCISGAISTMISSAFLAQAVLKPSQKFGVFMALNISFSVIVALLVFPASLMIFGPQGTAGDLPGCSGRAGGSKGGGRRQVV